MNINNYKGKTKGKICYLCNDFIVTTHTTKINVINKNDYCKFCTKYYCKDHNFLRSENKIKVCIKCILKK